MSMTVLSATSARLTGSARKPSFSQGRPTFARQPLQCMAKKQGESGWPTVYRAETAKLVHGLVTRQAVKTALVFFGETNGQNHLFLTNWLSENPITVDSHGAADAWLVKLACTPITTVSDPRRSSIVTVATVAAATKGEREVSPRDIAERIMAIRIEIARELGMDIDTDKIALQNQEMLRKALTNMVTDKPQLPTL